MRIAVTGSVGMLGRAVADLAVARDHEVVGIDRRTPDPADTSPDFEHVTADICEKGSLRSPFARCDAVIHTASLVDLHLGRPTILDDVNVLGVEHVLEAARSCDVGRVVHMSSAEVITGRTPLRGVTEADATYPDEHLTHYGRTKQFGEERVLAAAGDELGTVAMRTYGIYGPRDRTVVRQYLRRMPSKRIAFLGDLSERTDLIFAENLAHAMVLAAEQLEPDSEWSGSAMHVSDGDPLNLQRFMAELVSPLGYTTVERPRVPYKVAYSVASAAEARFARAPSDRLAYPPLTRHSLLLATGNYWVDSSRIREVLGYVPPVDRADAVAITQEWLRKEHLN